MNHLSEATPSSSIAATGGMAMDDSQQVDFESIFETMRTADSDIDSAHCGSYAGCRKTSCGTSSFINW